jgi:hypothetical protein
VLAVALGQEPEPAQDKSLQEYMVDGHMPAVEGHHQLGGETQHLVREPAFPATPVAFR